MSAQGCRCYGPEQHAGRISFVSCVARKCTLPLSPRDMTEGDGREGGELAVCCSTTVHDVANGHFSMRLFGMTADTFRCQQAHAELRTFHSQRACRLQQWNINSSDMAVHYAFVGPNFSDADLLVRSGRWHGLPYSTLQYCYIYRLLPIMIHGYPMFSHLPQLLQLVPQ